MSASYDLAIAGGGVGGAALAMQLIVQDPTRQPDSLFSGPDMAADETARKRFLAED